MDRSEGLVFLIPLLLAGVVAMLLAPAGAVRGAASVSPAQAFEPPVGSGSGSRLLGEFLGRDAAGPDAEGPSSWCQRHLIALVPDPLESRFDYIFDRHLAAIQRAVEGAGYRIDRYDLPWADPAGSSGSSARGGGSKADRLVLLDRDPEAGSPGELLLVQEPEAGGDRSAPRHLREPGRILFRCAGAAECDEESVLIVHLVGETPTSGVHKPAFKAALDEVAGGLTGRCGAKAGADPAGGGSAPPMRIDVMGPAFSGSATSVRLALESWRRERWPEGCSEGAGGRCPPVRFVSGSATAIRGPGMVGEPGLHDAFHATVYPDEIAIHALIDYLKEHLEANSRQIAMLSEASTAFGRQERRLESKEEDLLWIHFPLHISDLRSATAAADEAAAGGRSGDVRLGPTSVPLPLQERIRPGELISSVSSEDPSSTEGALNLLLSAIGRERILYVGILATDVKDVMFLARKLRERVPNVQLFTFASDVLYLHPRQNPYLRGMFVVTPYTLLPAMQLWTPPYNGTLRRQSFPDQTAQGVYNATVYLLDRPEGMLDYGPLELGRLSSKHVPGGGTDAGPEVPARPRGERSFEGPSLWLASVGGNGIYPVSPLVESSRTVLPGSLRGAVATRKGPPDGFAGDVDAEGYPLLLVDREKQDARSRDPNAPWRRRSLLRGMIRRGGVMGYMAVTLGGLIGAVGLLFTRERRAALSRRLENARAGAWGWRRWVIAALEGFVTRFRVSMLEDARDRKFLHERRAFLLGLGATLLILNGFVLLLVLSPTVHTSNAEVLGRRGDPVAWGWVIAAGASVLVTLLLAWSVVELIRKLAVSRGTSSSGEKGSDGEEQLPVSRMLVLATWTLLALSLIRGVAFMVSDPSRLLPLVLRSIDLHSGLSPFIPLLLLAVGGGLYVGCHLRRLRMAESPAGRTWREAIYFGNSGPAESLGRYETKIRRSIVVGAMRLRCSWVALGVVALASVFVIFTQRWWPMEDAILGAGGETPWVMSRLIEGVLPAAFGGICLGLVLTLLRLVDVWIEFRQMLHYLAAHQLYAAFVRLRKESPGGKIGLGLAGGRIQALRRSVRLARGLETIGLVPEAGASQEDSGREVRCALASARLSLHRCRRGSLTRRWDARIEHRSRANRSLAMVTREAFRAVQKWWERGGLITDKKGNAQQQVENYLASRGIALLESVVPQIRNLAVCSTVGLLLLLLCVSAYPFQNRDALLYFCWPLVLLSVAITIYVWSQMNRDTLISVLADLPPGRLHWDRDFILRIIFYGLLPLTGLLGAQYPGASSGLIPWIQSLAGMAQP